MLGKRSAERTPLLSAAAASSAAAGRSTSFRCHALFPCKTILSACWQTCCEEELTMWPVWNAWFSETLGVEARCEGGEGGWQHQVAVRFARWPSSTRAWRMTPWRGSEWSLQTKRTCSCGRWPFLDPRTPYIRVAILRWDISSDIFGGIVLVVIWWTAEMPLTLPVRQERRKNIN